MSLSRKKLRVMSSNNKHGITSKRYVSKEDAKLKERILEAKSILKHIYNGGGVDKKNIKTVAETLHDLDKHYEFLRLREWGFVSSIMHLKSLEIITEKEQSYILKKLSSDLNIIKERIEIEYQK
jgi:hypothetical protein